MWRTLATHTMVLIAVSALTAVLFVTVVGFADRADAKVPVVLDPRGVSVSAYGGWAAWSRLDATTNRYALVLRSPQGTISPAPVAESGSPLDVELGPSGSGVAAVYSRCADGLGRQHCSMAELQLGTNAVTGHVLAPPGGGSNHEPAIWGNRVVFLHRNSAGPALR